EPARGPGLPAGRPRRPGPGRLRSAVVALAEPEPAADRSGDRRRGRRAAGLLARGQTHGLRARRARAIAQLPALSGRRVDDVERVPPGRARLPVAPLRDLVP